MSTITAILEPDSDGCVHLPVPEEMRGGRVRVIASVLAAEDDARPMLEAKAVSPEAARRLRALRQLSASLHARGVDYEQWQRDIREARR